MSFNDDASLDTSELEGGSGGGSRMGGLGGGPMMIGGGGGILGLILMLVIWFFNSNSGGGGSLPVPNPGEGRGMDTSQVDTGGQASRALFEHCKTGADANRDVNCRMVGTVNMVQQYWGKELAQQTGGKYTYRKTPTVLYRGVTQSACGTASNQVGPFYCPLDKRVFIDGSFFDILEKKFGAGGGSFAQMYVVAHEYGHVIQDQLGLLARAQRDPQGPESGGVKIELMADCLAGMWAQHATEAKDANGKTFLKPLTQNDIKSALDAAAAVGDDHIQKTTTGRVMPEKFSHGTSAQRMRWFQTGFQGNNINQCNTFKAASL